MIAFLRGELLGRVGDVLVVDVCGVGYEVLAVSSVLETVGAEGSPISLLVYTDVKDNGISLYGFSRQLEKEVFLLLKRVKGIGSRLALGILSAIGAEGLLLSVSRSDLSALMRAPGVGKKTAERLLVELRDAVSELAADIGGCEATSAPGGTADTGFARTSTDSSSERDAVSALERLGFQRDKAERAVAHTFDSLADDERRRCIKAGELLKLALPLLCESA